MPEFELGRYYDQMINWERRLGREGPFYKRLFEERSVRTVLDCACGTGRHAEMFASWGLDVAASDIDEDMLAQTRDRCGSTVKIVESAFGDLPEHFDEGFDAVVCVGNSLSAVLDEEEYLRSLSGIAGVVRPGGIAVLQVLNAAAHPDGELRFSPIHEIEHEGVRGPVLRWRYRHGRHLMAANVFLAKTDAGWQPYPRHRALRAFWPDELTGALGQAGLTVDTIYGTYEFAPLSPDTHTDLITVATRPA